jgi:hypothetical protein
VPAHLLTHELVRLELHLRPSPLEQLVAAAQAEAGARVWWWQRGHHAHARGGMLPASWAAAALDLPLRPQHHPPHPPTHPPGLPILEVHDLIAVAVAHEHRGGPVLVCGAACAGGSGGKGRADKRARRRCSSVQTKKQGAKLPAGPGKRPTQQQQQQTRRPDR